MTGRPRVAVVGGGIAGLAAARALAGSCDVTLYEPSGALGGKLGSADFRGRPLDRGPDAFIARNPTAVDLCRALGLGDELITPSATTAAIWSRGRLRPFPLGLAIGIPTDFTALWRSGIVSPLAAARAAADAVLPGRVPATLLEDARTGLADPTVGELIGRRLGRAVLGALVDPLIGGINASDVAALSFVAALPQLAPLVAGKRRIAPALRPSPPPSPGGKRPPAFFGLERGLGSLIGALERDLRAAGVTVESTAVEAVDALEGSRWRLTLADGPREFDGVVLATPAPSGARIVRSTAPGLASEADAIPYAGVVTVALAWPEAAVPGRTAAELAAIARPSTAGSAAALPGSGVLVPRDGRHLVTAATFTSTKWPRSANPGEVVVRVSAGRHHDDRALALDDTELLSAVRGELEAIVGISAPPLEHRIERWPASFPQYVSGHLARVGRIRAECARLGSVTVCGAAYDGIGIPACIESGVAAAEQLVKRLSPRPATAGE